MALNRWRRGLRRGTSILDHPFVTLAGGDPVKAEAAAALFQQLTDETGIPRWSSNGFRSPVDGSAPFATPELGLRRSRRRRSQLHPHRGRRHHPAPVELSRSAAAGCLDVSGSMAAQIAGTAETKMSLGLLGSAGLAALFGSDSELGAWAYLLASTARSRTASLPGLVRWLDFIGGTPRIEVLRSTLQQLTCLPSGGTAIFDTALAAYCKATADYDQRKINVIVLFTDGLSEGPNVITQEELIASLRAEFNPKKPVRFITTVRTGRRLRDAQADR